MLIVQRELPYAADIMRWKRTGVRFWPPSATLRNTESTLASTLSEPRYDASPSPQSAASDISAGSDFWTLLRWPSRKPTLQDIYWLAGLVEGEGSFTSGRVVIAQKGREILDWVQELFGGRVFGPIVSTSVSGATPMHRWYATGRRGRGIARTLYHLMSSRRQAQIRAYLKVSRPSELPEPLSPQNPLRYLTDWDESEDATRVDGMLE